MVKIVWSENALTDLNEIGEYIAHDSTRYAKLTVQKLYVKPELLYSFPKMGRVVPEIDNDSIRELIEGNYRIIYEIQGDLVNILTIHNSSRVLTLKG